MYIEAEETCTRALELGYRHINTAHTYQNERGVGAVVKVNGIVRAEIWITSTLWPRGCFYNTEKIILQIL
ncbi:hypothetical protein CBFG_00821 [Clostridiales bacterium 1_7_47FAA]|nr:hypothetical protein CBFG_00821 [Clostridiales bacterium 1_7_47FAA]